MADLEGYYKVMYEDSLEEIKRLQALVTLTNTVILPLVISKQDAPDVSASRRKTSCRTTIPVKVTVKVGVPWCGSEFCYTYWALTGAGDAPFLTRTVHLDGGDVDTSRNQTPTGVVPIRNCEVT